MKNTILKFGAYGLLLGLVLFLAGVLFVDSTEIEQGEVVGYLTMVASLIFVYFGIKHYRDKINNGTISFGKAVAIGLGIAAFAAIGVGIADYIYTAAINPDFFEEYKAAMRAKGNTEEIPDWGSGFMAFVMFLTVMIIGLIISLISAFILQRKIN